MDSWVTAILLMHWGYVVWVLRWKSSFCRKCIHLIHKPILMAVKAGFPKLKKLIFFLVSTFWYNTCPRKRKNKPFAFGNWIYVFTSQLNIFFVVLSKTMQSNNWILTHKADNFCTGTKKISFSRSSNFLVHLLSLTCIPNGHSFVCQTFLLVFYLLSVYSK